ncbi:MAG: hypothetical protein GXP39_07880 [Chloroflexi bacterium]|nr:hypothetical protein [Chloroflexota bacterium]
MQRYKTIHPTPGANNTDGTVLIVPPLTREAFRLFVPPILIAIGLWAGGFASIATAVLVLPAWTVLYTIGSSLTLSQLAYALMMYRLEAQKERNRHEEAMAQLSIQKSVSMARAQLEIERHEIAAKALTASATSPLDGGTLWDISEQALIDAVLDAYRVAGPDGYLPNDKECPFGRRALGGLYTEIRYRLANPGEKFGIAGSPPVATYDKGSKRWHLNLKDYPTAAQALQALTGRRWLAQ